jgi:hypothetical protein
MHLQYHRWPLHSSGGWSLAFHGGEQSSISGQVMWNLWRTKYQWGRFPPGTSVSPANSHSTDYSTLIISYRRCHNRPVRRRRTKWTQSLHTSSRQKMLQYNKKCILSLPFPKYKFNLTLLLCCSKSEFLWIIMLCVNGLSFLGGEKCNQVISCPKPGVYSNVR